MKDLKIVKYAVSVDVDIMQENGMGREEIKKWFNTPCDSEEGYNGYLAEDIPAGNYTLDQLNEIVDERLDEVFGKEPISNV